MDRGTGTGYCFRSISSFVSLFLCLFVSLSARLRENFWTDLHEIFREGVEWPWDDPMTFLVNSEKPRDAAMRNTGTGFVVLLHHSLLYLVKLNLWGIEARLTWHHILRCSCCWPLSRSRVWLSWWFTELTT